MKKLIVVLALVLTAVLVFSSCANRGNEDEIRDSMTTPDLNQILDDLKNNFETADPEDSGMAVAEILYKAYDDHAEVIGCDTPIGEVRILAEFEGKPVTAIAEGAFSNKNTISSVVLPEGITTIGARAFMSCAMMKSVNIPDSVETIGTYAFFGCAALEELTVGAGVKTIGDNAFSSCNLIKEFKIADGNTAFAVDGGVLFSADKTTLVAYPTAAEAAEYTIPASVKKVNNFAFAYAANLTKVSMSNVTDLGDYTFSACFKLEKVDLGKGLTTIGAGLFRKCYALKSIVIPEGVKTIGYVDAEGNEAGSAFQSCMSLAEITLPSTLTNVYRSSFYGCDALAKVNFNGSSEQWAQVTISDGNTALSDASVVTK